MVTSSPQPITVPVFGLLVNEIKLDGGSCSRHCQLSADYRNTRFIQFDEETQLMTLGPLWPHRHSPLIYVQNNLRLVGPFMKSYWALKILKCTWWIVIVAEHESGLAWGSHSIWLRELQKFLIEACWMHLMMLLNSVSNEWQMCHDAWWSFHSISVVRCILMGLLWLCMI